MSRKSDSFYPLMFRTAALFNFLIAVMLAFFQRKILPWLGMEPVVNEAFLHLFLGLVFVFGLGYYRISLDIENNYNLIWMGIWGKSAVVVILLLHAVLGNLSWGVAALGLGDVLFTLLFIRFLFASPAPG